MSLNEYMASAIADSKKAEVTPSLAPVVLYGDELVAALGLESIEDFAVEAELDLQRAEGAVAEGNQLIASLESIHAFVVEAKDNRGGLTAPEASFAMGQFNVLTDKVSALRSEIDLPSLESFEAEGGALESTVLAMEGIGETAANVAKVISNAIQAAMKAALKFYDQHVALAGRVGKQAAALKEAATTRLKEDASPKEAKLKLNLPFLFADGQMVSDVIVIKQAKDFAKGAKALHAALKQYADALAKVDAEKLAETNADVKTARAALDAALKDAFDLVSDATASEAKDYPLPKSMTSVKVSNVLAGNRVLAVGFPAEGSDLTPTFAMASASKAKAAPEELDALTAKDIVVTAARAEAIVSAHGEIVAAGRELAATGKDMIKAANAAVKAVKGSEAGGEQANDFMDAVKDTKELSSLVRKPFIDLAKWIAQAANANVKYAKASLGNLQKAKKEEK